jgi:hypothetical protein
MAIEKATERRSKSSRRIKLPGGEVRYADTSPEAIARVLRGKSKLGQREAKLKEAEAKIGR